jgi:hypothetical protein
MFYTQTINKIKNFFSDLNIRQRANIFLSAFLLFTTIAAGLTAITLLPNIDRTRTAEAAPVCIGDPAYSNNTFYSTADSLCHTKIGFAGNKCFDFSLPDTSNTCGVNSPILYNCSRGYAGQTQVIDGSPDDKLCTRTPTYVTGRSCVPRYLNNPNNLAKNKENIRLMLEYSSSPVTWVDSNYAAGTQQTQTGQYWNDHICKDFTSPCPAGWRIIATGGMKYSATGDQNVNNYALNVACIQTNFADGTLLHSSPVRDVFFNVQNDQLDGNNQTDPYINKPRQGNESCYPSGYDYEGRMANSVNNRSVMCIKNSYPASIPYCIAGFSTIFTVSFNGCEKTFAVTNCALGSYINSTLTACTQCPVNTYCPLQAENPTNCPTDMVAAIGSGSCTQQDCVTVLKGDPQCSANYASDVYSYVKYIDTAGTSTDKTISANKGSVVTARVYYDNLTDNEITETNIKTALPDGFSYQSGSFAHCKRPNANELKCDTQTPNVKDNMFNTLINGGLSPAAGFYCNSQCVQSATDPIVPLLGNSPTSTTGILDAGKKQYLNLNVCNYYNAGSLTKRFNLLIPENAGLPDKFGSQSTDASNTPSFNQCELGSVSSPLAGKTSRSYGPLSDKINFNLAQCAFNYVSGGRWSTWNDVSVNIKALSNTSDSTVFSNAAAPCTTILGSTIGSIAAGDVGYETAKLPGKRYLNLLQCSYNNLSPTNQAFDRHIELIGNTPNGAQGLSSKFEASDTPITADSLNPSSAAVTKCGIPAAGTGYALESRISGYKAVDMLDKKRARGFFEFKMSVPNTAQTLSTYTQSVTLTGKNSLGEAIVPVTALGTINTNGTAVATCNAGSSLVNAACVTCPVNTYCTGGIAPSIPCTAPATTNGLTGSDATTDCVAPSCTAGNYLNNGTCVTCPVNTYCTGGIAPSIPCTAPATTNGATGSDQATDCILPIVTTCNAGSYISNETCVTCPINTYCLGGTASYANCPTATPNTASTGSTSAAACTSTPVTTCNAGSYISNGTCVTCPINTYCLGGTASYANCPTATPNTASTGSTSAAACIATCLSPNTLINNICTPPNNIPSIGTSVATTTTPIGTALGSLLPIIPLLGNTYPDGTVATFTAQGTTTAITGTIVSGSFVPTQGQVVPSNATTGPATGVLAIGTTTLNIPTNFTPTTGTTTIGTTAATPTNPLVATVGDPVFNIPLVGSTILDGTIATFTPPGSTVVITGKIIAGVFVPDANQTIPVTGVTTGPAIGILKVNDRIIGVFVNIKPPTNFVSSIGTPVATAANPIGGAIGTTAPAIILSGNTFSNGTSGTFTPNGSTEAITGKIINGNFIPNIGQLIPTTSTVGNNIGILKVDTQTVNVPTNFSAQIAQPNNPGNGGVITICSPACSTATATTPIVAATTNNTQTNTQTPIAAKSVEANSGVFKSKLRITDPYICGEGSYGNVPNPKAFGVDFVYYDFYKVGSTTPSYSYKLRLADNGDFFLPISKSTNVIKEGDYKVVFYAYDAEGNKAQGDYTDFITDNCANSKVIRSGKTDLPRTGGLEIVGILTFFSSALTAGYLYHKSRSRKEFGLKM